jgi:hypothetical protein
VISTTGVEWVQATATEYSGVQQSSQPDSTGQGDSGGVAVASLNISDTITVANSWAVACISNFPNNTANGTNMTFRVKEAANSQNSILDSNAPLATGAQSLNIGTTGGNASLGGAVVAFKSF